MARDEAFSFIYRENLEALKRLGKVVFFSPMEDEEAPEADLLYLAGGYPEIHPERLAGNGSMLQSLRAHHEKGGRILAECGGMMYLGQSIADKEGHTHSMVGLFPYQTTMEPMKLTLGYRIIHLGNEEFRGHEFHYSVCSGDEDLSPIGHVTNARGEPVKRKIYKKGRTFATYIHFYWGEGDRLEALLGKMEEKTPKDH